ncbi:MAG: SprT-like domain-containing protein [Polyangiaceae bacterium]|nr:SprT-like domain-containing protein [Polyangiaceae bacterium]
MPPSADAGPVLTAKLEAALLREIVEQYRLLAQAYFKGALALPQFELVMSRTHLGRWVDDTRTIELSRPLVLEESWGVVVEVLKHEMAHQYTSEVLGERQEAAHGPTFRAVCNKLGIDAAATGKPAVRSTERAEDTSGSTHRKIGERIAHLLALAESPNVHEAEAAMLAAQRLLLKHNVMLQKAKLAQGYAFLHLGKPTGRTTEAERTLSLILGKHFFVEAIWVPVYRPLEGKRGSVLEICGTEENLEIAEYVHGYLVETAERLWNEHRKTHGIRSNRDRRTYLAGVMTGMNDKLSREAKSSKKAGLIWVADGDLASFFRKRHPHVRHMRYAGQKRTDAYAHGREAGRQIVLHKGIKAKATNRGLLLGP